MQDLTPRLSRVAILGAGPIGAAVAHRLAEQGRVAHVSLIDERESVAAGKALDIRQAGPVGRFDAPITAHASPLDALSADVIVIADEVEGGEWRSERGLAMLHQLVRGGLTAPLVFAGPDQMWLLETAARELHVPTDRLIGTAPAAMVAATRALVGLEVDGSGAEVDAAVVGVPGRFVVAWSSATVAGSLVTDRIAAHRLIAIADSLHRLWPPGPQAIAAATAPVVHALMHGSRRVQHGVAVTDESLLEAGLGAKGRALLLPLAIGLGRILRRLPPTLTPQERVRVGPG